MGIKYIEDQGNWQWQLAYYLNAGDFAFRYVEGSPNCFSYDILGRNKENNQLNVKIIDRKGRDRQHEMGFSTMAGLLYNLDTEKIGYRYAGAVH